MQAGYSARPLAAKLGIKAGMRAALIHAPETYLKLLSPIPEGVIWVTDLAEGEVDFIQYFTSERAALTSDFVRLKGALRPAGMLWVSWPKRAAKVPTDLDENIVRQIALDLGLVDVKVAAVDSTWSALKLVYRLIDRPTG
jgi:hypothetical protein